MAKLNLKKRFRPISFYGETFYINQKGRSFDEGRRGHYNEKDITNTKRKW